MATQRGKNIDNRIIEEIVGILDGWSDTLTWERLIVAIEKRIGVAYTRQALHQHTRILSTFQLRKITLSEKMNLIPKPARLRSEDEVEMLIARNERLLAENTRLKIENMQLLEQFVVWAYNAHTKGLNDKALNKPLPTVNRESTRVLDTFELNQTKHNKNTPN